MPDALTPREVAHIARLARLELAPGEEEAFARQLTDILAYAATVQQVDTTSLKSASDAVETSRSETSLRADTPIPGISRDAALAAAPDRSPDGAFFRVPKVL
jgi:aspartyl-tRNA(Asn)/glutamyl-tRNA(Gln) amidotransferase subunit C